VNRKEYEVFDHHFDRMGKVLVQSGVVPEDRRAEAEAALKLAWRGKIALSWSVDDVLDACPGLTEEEAEEVLEESSTSSPVHERVGAGIREVIEDVAIDLFGERALEGSEDEDDEDEA
jgi:hypothetical protein